MTDPGPAIARFDFPRGGPLRGSYLTLYPNCLVHQGGGLLETLPLRAIASVRVAFERDERKLRWGIGFIVVALVLFAVAAPLGSFAASAAGEMAGAGGQGVARLLQGFFSALQALSGILPVAAALVALGGAAMGALGWFGTTRLTLALPGHEREYPARGRDAKLLDFTELLAAQVVSAAK
ncbi:MAG TPA: hypothetical protein VFB08_08785 [Burkholderiales bacterium]|nr:hypothetical protein [Burkholderiales bacterium]